MKRHKYNARKVTIDGHRFDSKREAERYGELKLLERAGEIRDLELQPRFTLQDSFIRKGKRYREIDYIADFVYQDAEGNRIVEDVKGMKTEVYKIKRKMFIKRHGEFYEHREVS